MKEVFADWIAFLFKLESPLIKYKYWCWYFSSISSKELKKWIKVQENIASFNLNQSDPHFKATAGTQQLIDEKLKKRKLDSVNFSSSRTDRDEDDLVVKLKRKTAKKD